MKQTYFFTLVVLLLCGTLGANDITVSTARVIPAADYSTADIAFDLSWGNSWRVSATPNNWDAAWVFAKFRVDQGDWQHVTLGPLVSAPTDATVDIMDNQGAMIYHSSDFSGTTSFQDVQIAWDLAADGYDGAGDLELKVFALEMVYIPEGAFSLGTGPDTNPGGPNEVDEFYTSGTDSLPYVVSNDGPITVGTAPGNLYFEDTEDPNATIAKRPALRTGTIPATYPQGFRAFYLMKYEMSQQQWVEFYNTLTLTQRQARNVSRASNEEDADPWRNGVDTTVDLVATTSRPVLPMGYLSQNDMFTYLDWAALRPMTEMEFEKAARGTADPVQLEFVWGNKLTRSGGYEIGNKNRATEVVQGPSQNDNRGNAALGTIDDGTQSVSGPLRCGIFAASIPVANRVYAGAGFYGNMELSGNQWESVVVMTDSTSRTFTNTHGDGVITAEGLFDVPTWPTTRNGVGFRGGRTDNAPTFGHISDRTYTTLQFSTADSRYKWLQARGVRGL